jgi:cyclophilin family peptidyl-prolyl cis-trans isomerase
MWLFAGCGSGAGADGAEQAAEAAKESVTYRAAVSRPQEREVAVLEVRGLGEIRIELLAEKAPKTVANFKKLAGEGFYDGTTFHRVIPGFMIQGGDPNTKNRDPRDDGKGHPGYRIEDEPNDTAHLRGVVSMANRGRPGTAGSQYFIVVGNSPHLDGAYTAFGLVTAGMEVADAIAQVPRDQYGRHGPKNRPLDDVVVESVWIEAAGATASLAESGEARPKASTAASDSPPSDRAEPSEAG